MQCKRRRENKGPMLRPKKKKRWEKMSFSATGTETCIHIARHRLFCGLGVIESKHTLEIVI
jgi:hypothetical protein